MASTCVYNVFVGSETGLLKGIQIAEQSWQNLNAVADANRSREITSLCWGDADKTEVCAGLRDNCVLTFDSSGASAREHGPYFGASGHIKTIAKFEDKFLTGFSDGVLAVWSDDIDEKESVKISTGDNLWAVAQNSATPNHIATGGKENPLKLWDINHTDAPIFCAKNVRNDWLNLRVPVWVTRVRFLMDHRRVVTGTGGNEVRVYDPGSSQRRPVIDFKFMSNPITALSVCGLREQQVVVANTLGDMGLLDLRRAGVVHLYKGFSGGITDLQCHSAVPVVVSCSVDRYVRVHNLLGKAVEEKFYLKSRLNCLLLNDEWRGEEETQTSSKQEVPGQAEQQETGQSGDEDNVGQDTIWDSLGEVNVRTVSANSKAGQKRQGAKCQEKTPMPKNKKKKKQGIHK